MDPAPTFDRLVAIFHRAMAYGATLFLKDAECTVAWTLQPLEDIELRR